MKTASTSSAVTLGTKRTCPKCALKFYDFSKPTIQCPKCGTEVDPQAQSPLLRTTEAKKSKAKPILDEEEATPGASEEAFESVDDLGDDDESLEELASNEGSDEEDA
jgi:uncharacterized protein (TIGR02300 family)